MMALIRFPVQILPGEGPALQGHIAAHAALLGDGGGARVDNQTFDGHRMISLLIINENGLAD